MLMNPIAVVMLVRNTGAMFTRRLSISGTIVSSMSWRESTPIWRWRMRPAPSTTKVSGTP